MTKANKTNEGGQVMTETLLCMMFLCLLLFGLLQIFHLSVAQMLTDYGAYCSARTRAVGFDEQLGRRSARVAVIGAAGMMTRAGSGSGTGKSFDNLKKQLKFEKSRIPYYLDGSLYLEYDHWNTVDENAQGDGIKDDDTFLNITFNENSNTTNVKVQFEDYPFTFLTGSSKDSRDDDPAGGSLFLLGDTLNIDAGHKNEGALEGEGVTLRNHAADYLIIGTQQP